MNRATPEARAQRIVTSERAREAAQRLIDAAFRNSGKERPTFSVPVDTDDDDVVIMDYIKQREEQSSEQS